MSTLGAWVVVLYSVEGCCIGENEGLRAMGTHPVWGKGESMACELLLTRVGIR